MRLCISKIKPNAIVHLGDHYDDGQVIAEENPCIPFYQVPGNCDRYRCPPFAQETLVLPVCGVSLYMTHGHNHRVKCGLGALLRDARQCNVQAVLYGHTHQADCHREEDGLWVLNPGSCGSYGGSAGLIETEKNAITACRIIKQADLEELS
jgi:putative phosphoesterase